MKTDFWLFDKDGNLVFHNARPNKGLSVKSVELVTPIKKGSEEFHALIQALKELTSEEPNVSPGTALTVNTVTAIKRQQGIGVNSFVIRIAVPDKARKDLTPGQVSHFIKMLNREKAVE